MSFIQFSNSTCLLHRLVFAIYISYESQYFIIYIYAAKFPPTLPFFSLLTSQSMWVHSLGFSQERSCETNPETKWGIAQRGRIRNLREGGREVQKRERGFGKAARDWKEESQREKDRNWRVRTEFQSWFYICNVYGILVGTWVFNIT